MLNVDSLPGTVGVKSLPKRYPPPAWDPAAPEVVVSPTATVLMVVLAGSAKIAKGATRAATATPAAAKLLLGRVFLKLFVRFPLKKCPQ